MLTPRAASLAVVEEHQRLACEIANLQTRKAILTAPIVRSGGVMEPSHEELLAQQQDPSGAPSPCPHATPSPHPGFLPPDRSPPALFLPPC